jgi:hypothetical protein
MKQHAMVFLNQKLRSKRNNLYLSNFDYIYVYKRVNRVYALPQNSN